MVVLKLIEVLLNIPVINTSPFISVQILSLISVELADADFAQITLPIESYFTTKTLSFPKPFILVVPKVIEGEPKLPVITM